MKKNIAQQLNAAAESTPLVFEWILLPEIFKGWELNLTPIADINPPFEPEEDYSFDMPAMRAVNHKQQFKDAYNRGGWQAVKEYHTSVMAKIDKIKSKA